MNSNLIESSGNKFLDLKPEDAQPEVLEQPVLQESSPAKPVYASLAGLALPACGGGGGSNGPIATPKPTEKEAARFLMQASFGGTYAQVQDVQTKGFEAWLDTELNKPCVEANSHFNWFKNHGYFDSRTLDTQQIGMDNSLWRKLMTSPDLLRQKVAYALSQIFVVSINGLGAAIWRNLIAVSFMDLLEKNAFGTYEDLLKAVSLSPAMGVYLNMKGSRKATDTTLPDENYAREVMQLFSIGLYQLNPDGSQILNSGKPVETYSQQNVTQLASIFTGWWFGNGNDPTKLDYVNQPMTNDGKYFTTGEKPFFEQNVPASASPLDAMNQVLKYLANHSNVGPFIGRQLIQRLVCSNPSPAYVARITKVFNDDGSANKVRGNLKAVIKAILLDDEARKPPDVNASAYSSYGKLKEPVVRLAQWGRTVNAGSSKASDTQVQFNTDALGKKSVVEMWSIGDLSDDTKLGQAPMRSPSVFNFFRPGYVPPSQGKLGTASVTAPEFQLCNEVTVAAYLNFIKGAIETGINDVVPNYSADDIALAKNPTDLVNRYSLLLTGDTLSVTNKGFITTAISEIIGPSGPRGSPSRNFTEAEDRIQATLFLIMATPEYMVQK